MKYRFLKVLFFMVTFVISFAAMAQPRPPNPDGEPVPISGVEWLLLSGGLLGARKIYKNLKDRK
jgi:hypothetical protein